MALGSGSNSKVSLQVAMSAFKCVVFHCRVAVRWWTGARWSWSRTRNRTRATVHFTRYIFGGWSLLLWCFCTTASGLSLGGGTGLSLGGGLGGTMGNTNKGLLGGLNLAGAHQKGIPLCEVAMTLWFLH